MPTPRLHLFGKFTHSFPQLIASRYGLLPPAFKKRSTVGLVRRSVMSSIVRDADPYVKMSTPSLSWNQPRASVVAASRAR